LRRLLCGMAEPRTAAVFDISTEAIVFKMSHISGPVMALSAVSDAKADAGGQSLDGRMQSEFFKISKVDSGDASPEGRMLNAFAQYSEAASSRLNRIGEVGRGGSDDPMRLLKVQAELTKFHIEMSLSSALARKGVAVVETLVKA